MGKLSENCIRESNSNLYSILIIILIIMVREFIIILGYMDTLNFLFLN